MNTIKQMYSYGGFTFMRGILIEERAISLAHYIIDFKFLFYILY